MTTTVTRNAQAMTSRPSRQKSPNLYPPGPYTIRLLPLANGVRNETLAPMATASIIGSADTPSSEAVAMPIGIMTSAAEVLEMNWLTTADTTGAVAAMLPVVVVVAVRTGVPPSRLMVPLAFACLTGAKLTLLGTPLNVIAATQADEAGVGHIGFFEWAVLGGPLLLGTIVIVVLLGKALLPERRSQSIPADFSAHADAGGAVPARGRPDARCAHRRLGRHGLVAPLLAVGVAVDLEGRTCERPRRARRSSVRRDR
jgi:hypothetical protein